MQRSTLKNTFLATFATLLCASAANAASIASSTGGAVPAGTLVTFTVGGEGHANEAYRLAIGPAGKPAEIRVVRDFHDATPQFDWMPIDPGAYIVIGSVLDIDTGVQTHAGMPLNVGVLTPAAVSQGVATPTSNPLVAMYSAPSCPTGVRMQVRFFSQNVGGGTTTQAKKCESGTTMNFIVAGMRADETYLMQHQVLGPTNNLIFQSPFTSFDTGTPTIAFPPSVEAIPYDVQASILESTIFQSPIIGTPALGLLPNLYAVDLTGAVTWYLERDDLAYRPAGNGTFWTNRTDPVTGVEDQALTKIDLLGNVVQETTITQINRQLAARGDDFVNSFHHESRLLPDGHTAVLTSVEKFVIDQQGPGSVNVIGDMIIVLDQNLQVVWTWNMFEWLDVSRLAIFDNHCRSAVGGCPPFFNSLFANDWTHSNAIGYSPADGNLIVSIRHQDWVVKMNYANGAGDGTILWRLGAGGDFTLTSGNDDDWFSHTHDTSYSGVDKILLFDNNNIRCESPAPPDCQSRGQEWQIDETLMTATPVVNIDAGQYAPAVGSAQLLLNGNYWFLSGLIGNPNTTVSQFQEFKGDGTPVFELEVSMAHYRSHRMLNLYTLPPYWGIPK